MDPLPFKIRLFQKPRFIPLHYRVIFIISCMLIIILSILALLMGRMQNRTMSRQIKERGESIAQSLAVAATADLVNYNYITLEQLANQSVQDPEIIYLIIHDKEGKVAAYSRRPDQQGKMLEDPVSLNALSAGKIVVQRVSIGGDLLGLETAVPVYLASAGERWGTIRVCLSLAPLRLQLRQTLWIILMVGLVSLICGIVVSIWGAGRITRPLGNLVQATIKAAKGDLDQNIQVPTADEVEILADNFSTMIRKIRDHQTRQEEQLAEIKRLQHYTEKLLTCMYDGLLSVDVKGRVAAINPTARSMLGITVDSTVNGKKIDVILKDNSPLRGFIHNRLNNPHLRDQQEMRMGNQADVLTLLVGTSVLLNDQGHPQEIIFNFHDISALKKLETRMRHAERMAALGTLAAGMAHEIRNPLSAIKTFVQLLPRKIDKPGFLDKFNRTVPRETERINLLIDELLELSRVPRYRFALTDISLLLKQTISTFELGLQQKNIECQFHIQNQLPMIWADANQLVKAFNNLSRNAAQAMPTGGTLVIESVFNNPDASSLLHTNWPPGMIELAQNSENPTGNETREPAPASSLDVNSDYGNPSALLAQAEYWPEGSITISFKDSGKGIPRKNLKNIFNPFFTTKESGTGLGLAITHKVITEHGGQIQVESGEGKGCCFNIELPVQRHRILSEDLPAGVEDIEQVSRPKSTFENTKTTPLLNRK